MANFGGVGGDTIICFGLHLFCHWIVAVLKGMKLGMIQTWCVVTNV